jgi:hypothetical protein
MATFDELLADAKAKERALKDKKTVLKDASRFTGSRYEKFRKDPKNKSQVDKLRATQAEAQREVEAADAAFKVAKKLADEAIEKKKLNPSAEEKQRLKDEAARRGEVYQDTAGQESPNVDLNSFTKKIEVAGRYIAELSDDGRRQLSQQLNSIYGSKLPTDGKYSAELKSAYIKALSDNLIRSQDFNQTIPFEQFLVLAEKEGTYKGQEGEGGSNYDPYGTLSVWDKTKTKSELTALFDNLGIDRDPTPKEVDEIYAKLNKKQKEQKATVTKFKVINGVRTAITSPGFNQGEFVTNLVKGTQEYKDIVDKKKKQEESKTLVSAQTLKGVADRNGINLSPEQLDAFALRVKKGEDITLVQNDIRKLAAIGQPDNVKKLIDSGVDLSTIYSPYKEALAQTLEINPNGITLNDPALRMAIGPDKEMSLYEYQKALRQDQRWQYTDQARSEASDIATKVLRDFGFMG